MSGQEPQISLNPWKVEDSTYRAAERKVRDALTARANAENEYLTYLRDTFLGKTVLFKYAHMHVPGWNPNHRPTIRISGEERLIRAVSLEYQLPGMSDTKTGLLGIEMDTGPSISYGVWLDEFVELELVPPAEEA